MLSQSVLPMALRSLFIILLSTSAASAPYVGKLKDSPADMLRNFKVSVGDQSGWLNYSVSHIAIEPFWWAGLPVVKSSTHSLVQALWWPQGRIEVGAAIRKNASPDDKNKLKSLQDLVKNDKDKLQNDMVGASARGDKDTHEKLQRGMYALDSLESTVSMVRAMMNNLDISEADLVTADDCGTKDRDAATHRLKISFGSVAPRRRLK